MPNSITTTGTTKDPLSTKFQSGESIRDWVKAHDDAVAASTPSGNTLTTTWPCATGQESVSTNRLPGESDEAFKLRHIADYLPEMLDCPPVP